MSEEAKTEETQTKEKQEEVAEAAPSELQKKYADLIEKIEGMTVIELSELVKAMEEKFGVSAAAMAVAAGGAGGGGGEGEKDSYNVVLKDAGGSKINVIKAVKEITGLGLKEAKDIVDSAPKAVKEGVKPEEAEELKKKLEEAGATIALE